MMVTFVSQCEKKSLAKTRRVLDTFANRIGSRTWQTVITNEGLQAVKKLLRKTASKNTAVSCHWIRSRSRSEFLWVVGKKDKFNKQGIVPVNFTTVTELNIDEINVMTDKFYANTHAQPLDQHLFAVGYLAHLIVKKLVDDETLANVAFSAGCWHDMGKIDPTFQGWLEKEINKKDDTVEVPEDGQHSILTGKFSFEKHPRHNEISLLLFMLLSQDKNLNPQNRDLLKHVIYWHHAKPIRKSEFKKLDPVFDNLKNNIGNGTLQDMYHAVSALGKKINALSEAYFENAPLLFAQVHTKPNDDDIYEIRQQSLARYKSYFARDNLEDYQDNIKMNARNSLVRSALVSADRFVSAISAEKLASHIEEQTLHELIDEAFLKERGLKAIIKTCLNGFEARYPKSERNSEQAKAAELLADEEVRVGVLNGPAGCGKTKIALEWAALSGVKKIIWICPRVQVCQGLLEDLTSKDYLKDATIEINTGEFKQLYKGDAKPVSSEGQEFSGDVVITTIDQVLNSILTHRNVTTLVDFMTAHVVFDEYHEYITMPAFNLLFAELLECKKMQEDKARVLLVSATPNYLFIEEFLGIDTEYDLVGIPSFNQSPYKIEFIAFDEAKMDDSNPFYQKQPENSFVISNTATTAQLSFIVNQSRENALLLHSKYTKKDKDDLFHKTFECFKRGGNHSYDVLRAGPIVQASLNISCGQMLTEFTTPENWLQRLGRLNRFAETEEVSVYTTAIPETIAEKGKQIGACAKFLGRLHSFQSAKAWREFLLDQEISEKPIFLSKIYQLYEDFYQTDKGKEAVRQDLAEALKKSVMVIDNKVIDPICFPKIKQPKKDDPKIKKHSLRGDNRFSQMGKCTVTPDFQPSFLNEYAYQEGDSEAHLTVSVDVICGYGDSNQDLLEFMVKKHHNIKGGKKSYKNFILLNQARSPLTPIYLSYTPEDLKLVEASQHSHSIYYAIGDNQPIGAISLNKLNSK